MSTLANAKGLEYLEVPEPLFKYSGRKIIHDENFQILSASSRKALLRPADAKKLKIELLAIEKRLERIGADALFVEYEQVQKAFTSKRLEYLSLKAQFESSKDESLKPVGATLRDELKALHERLRELEKRVSPLRADFELRNKLRDKWQGHLSAKDDYEKERALQVGMAREAQMLAEQISVILAGKGFKHDYTKKEKTHTDHVIFDYAVATPDQIQLKILAGKRGLWGGYVHLLPDGVYATEIIKEKVLDEISAAIEREVWSPHTAEEDPQKLINGTWIVIERMGLVEGIPTNVTYKQLMARYDTAEHGKFPIPAGLGTGRRINWLHLDSPSGIHLMFTGISGSGKSNAMRAMISCLVEKQSPKDIKFAFIDLKKQGDFREFSEAPHCLRVGTMGVITEISDVVTLLQSIRAEMHRRQTKIAPVANNVIDYNKRVEIKDRLPRIVIVFDEYANINRSRFSEEASEINDMCIEIAQIGRASGISLWLGIQQPRRDNMPPALRDNMTTMFIGHQQNLGASQSLTGNRDALKLEDYPGRMSVFVGWKQRKVQMPFIEDSEVVNAVRIAKQHHGATAEYELASPEDMPPETGNSSAYDDLVRIAIEELQGGVKARYIYDNFLVRRYPRDKVEEEARKVRNDALGDGVMYNGIKHKGEVRRGNVLYLIPIEENILDAED